MISREGNHAHDDIAVTAYNGLFPGADSPEQYWENILSGTQAPLSSMDRVWDMARETYYDREQGRADKIYFDKAFCINRDHGRLEDFQVRTGSDVVTSLVEQWKQKGPVPVSHRTGLVLAVSGTDKGYFDLDSRLVYGDRRDERVDMTRSVREQLETIAGSAGLSGPRMSIDTACASSIYAIHWGMKAIRSGMADVMVVCGLNLSLTYRLFSMLSQLMIISPEGRILPFHREASGIIVGEAAAAVVLEPVGNALNAGREIHGIIRSVGLSSDGASGSVYAPSGETQVLAYERAYRDIDPSTIDYIEAHGTATVTGDEVELCSIHDFFSRRPVTGKLPAGSVKGLIGHTLAASGMCSLVKCLLMIRNRTIPPHLTDAPHRGLEGACVSLPREPVVLADKNAPFRIGISSFGLGGSNAHLVLESFDGPCGEVCQKNIKAEKSLAIVDMETVFGKYAGPAQWKKANAAGMPPLERFPEQRFLNSTENEVEGVFFPESITMESMGLRMGPNLLKRVDPFQNLISGCVVRLAKRIPGLKDSENAGVIMCGNLGGARPLHLTRRDYLKEHAREMDVDGSFFSETTLEEITSSMANMCSGFPAYHLNLRGFHVTCSGGAGTFMNSLLCARQFIDDGCDTLVLGGGHYVSSPAGLVDWKHHRHNAPLLEGAGAFVIKDAEEAERSGYTILAEITDMVLCDGDDTFDSICAGKGIAAETVSMREKVNVSPETVPGMSSSFCMGESAGIEALVSILLKEGRGGAIEVYADGSLYAVIFIEKKRDFEAGPGPVTLPLALSFSDPYTAWLKDRGASVQTPVADSSIHSGMVSDACGALADGVLQYLKSQSRIVDELVSALSPDRAASCSGHLWHSSGPTENKSLDAALLQRHRGNTVIGPVTASGNRARSSLIINEEHPYFFDHPLDHVPGILFIEAMLQVTETVSRELLPDIQGLFISDFTVSFNSWCEKDQPVEIQYSQRPGEGGAARCSVAFVQNSGTVARAEFVLSDKRDMHNSTLAAVENIAPVSKKEYVHKIKEENVLVSDYETGGHGDEKIFRARALKPPDGHVLLDGDPDLKGALYFFEVSRQFMSLYAHSQRSVGLDNIVMTLLSGSIKLQRPFCIGEPLWLVLKSTEQQQIDDTFFSEDTVSLVDGDNNETGTCAFFSQVQDASAYKKDRY